MKPESDHEFEASAGQLECRLDIEARATGQTVLMAQFGVGRGLLARSAIAVQQMQLDLKTTLAARAVANLRTAIAGLRLTEKHVEAFFVVGQPGVAASLIVQAARDWGLPAPFIARRVPSTKTWIGLAPGPGPAAPGDIGALAAGPSLEELEAIDARLKAAEAKSAKLAELKAQLERVDARRQEVEDEYRLSLRDDAAYLAAHAWIQEQLAALSEQLDQLLK